MDPDIERLERKVDLLFAVLLNVHAESDGWDYDSGYMSQFFDVLLPLFGLKSIEERIKATLDGAIKRMSEDDRRREKEKITTKLKLEELRTRLERGDYLKREEDTLRGELETLEKKWKSLEIWVSTPGLSEIINSAYLEFKHKVEDVKKSDGKKTPSLSGKSYEEIYKKMLAEKVSEHPSVKFVPKSGRSFSYEGGSWEGESR